MWLDRTGKQVGSVGGPAQYSHPSLSPDEKKAAVAVGDATRLNRDIWVVDLNRGARSRLTFDPADDLNPVWSPDGSRIAFVSTRKGNRDLYMKRADGSGSDELLLASGEVKTLGTWSRDGQSIIFAQGEGIWMLRVDGDRKPVSIFSGLPNPGNAQQPQLSPNGRWIAYVSAESGGSEVYVQSFPATGGRWQISTGGGTEPRWRRDGKGTLLLGGRPNADGRGCED